MSANIVDEWCCDEELNEDCDICGCPEGARRIVFRFKK